MQTPPLPTPHRREAIGTLAAAGLGVAAGVSRPQAARASDAAHVVLLGDSSLDNRAYVGAAPDVLAHLRGRLPRPWRATLAAVDGAVVGDIQRQLTGLPADATHLLISVGGNDALRQEGLLQEAARSVGEGVARLAELRERFRRDYAAMLGAALARGLPVAVCTIYDPRFPDPRRQRLGLTGLALFNDVIIRAAFERGLPVLDLRLICDEDADFANPIEPSGQGGGKIAAAILRLLLEHDFARRRSEAFTGGSGP
ncbi:SGNH/GDSL hydrolase family protein [Roseomonas marmotae]|uniref:SGNH/GDSL hydrolase family protein n=1 Tax=Roseomonas marmotae TaxID=2768161 RepID=A0ABS3KGT5_9PROT|nr:SGNH/GDSL hydrolase family protein [Roseomonas marmotae]MBO1076632.1 SGNH/GDSL hydrolase family protein [Roseomonas marmotae]QTI79627.1 SGNH/GDSL hydrolase family protein [Roseomonas marmotae]